MRVRRCRKSAMAPQKGISVSLRMATAECSTGTETLASTEETISASRRVHRFSPSGSRTPLKKAAGL